MVALGTISVVLIGFSIFYFIKRLRGGGGALTFLIPLKFRSILPVLYYLLHEQFATYNVTPTYIRM